MRSFLLSLMLVQLFWLVTYPDGRQFLIPIFKKHPRLTDPIFDQYGTPKFYYQ